MRFNWMLLSGILGMLTTVAKDPDDGGKLQVAHMERNSTLAEISALKLGIVHLKEELDECAAGVVCFSAV